MFSAVLVICCGIFALLRNAETEGLTADIYLDGKLIESIDLNAVDAPYDFTVESEYGSNTVHVEYGGISVTAADCPDKVCVRQGVVRDSLLPIVCLPHRLVIRLEDGK